MYFANRTLRNRTVVARDLWPVGCGYGMVHSKYRSYRADLILVCLPSFVWWCVRKWAEIILCLWSMIQVMYIFYLMKMSKILENASAFNIIILCAHHWNAVNYNWSSKLCKTSHTHAHVEPDMTCEAVPLASLLSFKLGRCSAYLTWLLLLFWTYQLLMEIIHFLGCRSREGVHNLRKGGNLWCKRHHDGSPIN